MVNGWVALAAPARRDCKRFRSGATGSGFELPVSFIALEDTGSEDAASGTRPSNRLAHVKE